MVIALEFPKLWIVPPAIMLSPLAFEDHRKLGFRRPKEGILFGSPLFFLGLLLHPEGVLENLSVAIAEEVFFRGYLMPAFGNVVTSVLFALVHLFVRPTLGSLLTFFPSLFLGYLFLRSGSIIAPILAHTGMNLLFLWSREEFPELHHLLERELTGG